MFFSPFFPAFFDLFREFSAFSGVLGTWGARHRKVHAETILLPRTIPEKTFNILGKSSLKISGKMQMFRSGFPAFLWCFPKLLRARKILFAWTFRSPPPWSPKTPKTPENVQKRSKNTEKDRKMLEKPVFWTDLLGPSSVSFRVNSKGYSGSKVLFA